MAPGENEFDTPALEIFCDGIKVSTLVAFYLSLIAN